MEVGKEYVGEEKRNLVGALGINDFAYDRGRWAHSWKGGLSSMNVTFFEAKNHSLVKSTGCGYADICEINRAARCRADCDGKGGFCHSKSGMHGCYLPSWMWLKMARTAAFLLEWHGRERISRTWWPAEFAKKKQQLERALKTDYQYSRVRAGQIFPKSNNKTRRNCQNSNFKTLEIDQRHSSNWEALMHGKITELQVRKVGFCSCLPGASPIHPHLQVQHSGSTRAKEIHENQQPHLIWSAMWKTPRPVAQWMAVDIWVANRQKSQQWANRLARNL